MMTELADDMIDGFSCSGCGVYFETGHGYPVLCKGCKEEEPNSELPEATEPELG